MPRFGLAKISRAALSVLNSERRALASYARWGRSGSDSVDQVLGPAATAGRIADDDLLSILEHLAANRPASEFVRTDETHSVQSDTIGQQALGHRPRPQGS